MTKPSEEIKDRAYQYRLGQLYDGDVMDDIPQTKLYLRAILDWLDKNFEEKK